MMPSMPIGGGGGKQSVDFGGGGPSESNQGDFSAGSSINFVPPRSIKQDGQNRALVYGVIGLAVVGALWAYSNR